MESFYNYRSLCLLNIHPSTNEKQLFALFKPFGFISGLVLLGRKEEPNTQKIAFINYDCPKSARNAKKTLNGMKINEWELFINFEIRKQNRKSVFKLNIDNFPPSIDSKYLFCLVKKFGDIVNCVVCRDLLGCPLGYAYITTSHKHVLKDIVSFLSSNFDWGSRLIFNFQFKGIRPNKWDEKYLSYKQQKKEKCSSQPTPEKEKRKLNAVLVKGVTWKVNKIVVEQLFNKYGTVLNVSKVGKEKKKDVYKVVFEEEKSALKALECYRTNQKLKGIIEDSDKEGSFLRIIEEGEVFKAEEKKKNKLKFKNKLFEVGKTDLDKTKEER